MRDSLRTTIGQFSSSGRQTQARAANARAVEPAADLPGAERGNLYMLLEVTGSGGGHAALYRQMLNAAQTAFYEASGTLSAALVRAVRNAHVVLRRANEALPEARWRAGISLAALLGEELTIAQAGPALALVSHARTVDLFPADVEATGIPLGGDERPDVELFRTSIEPGSMVLLAQNGWLNQVTPEALAVAAAAANVSLARDYLGQLAGDVELSALLVSFSEEELPEVLDEVVPGAPDAGPFERGRVRPQAEMPPTRRTADDAAHALARGLAAGVGKLTEGVRGLSERAAADEPGPPPAAPPPAPQPAPQRAPQRHSLFGKPRPAEADVEASVTTTEEAVYEETPRRSLWPLLLAVIIIPVLIGAVVIGMLWLRAQTAETQLQETLNGAETAIAEARGLPDEAAARLRLSNARDFLDQARVLKPEDPRLADLEAGYQEVLDRVDHVTPLYGIVPLWDFKESGRQLERVVISGESLFVLDRGRHQVNRWVLSQLGDSIVPAEEPVVLRKAQQAGDAVVGDLVDMTWMEAVGNQRSKLLVLDTAGGLVSYDVTWGPDRVPVTGREQWDMPQLIRGYGGNLYVVDTKANQIWRYRPGKTGYENAPEPYFTASTQVDLAGVQSIAIDGHIWLLYADGRLLKFFVGEQQPFELRGLPDNLSAPTAVVVPLEGDRLYVADAGNGRIVELTKDGQFQRQFRPREGGDVLRGMRDLFLDATGSAFYVLTNDALFKANLPKPAVPTPTPAPAQ
ncbi:MAG: hypothetical protein CVU38_14240 [Chloroflexi bacterium HGW-Chloroflexi-1]|nr:MAG: hypothetical protein CVU38_14240 [Chloroflexi bacterium HGW-Chloroflexi-1]